MVKIKTGNLTIVYKNQDNVINKSNLIKILTIDNKRDVTNNTFTSITLLNNNDLQTTFNNKRDTNNSTFNLMRI